MPRLVAAAALAFAAFSFVAPAAAQEGAPPPKQPRKDRVTLDLLLDWENVSDPKLSPDGASIAFTRQWTDKVGDKLRSELWLMRRDGTEKRFLANGGSASWSPDGTRIAYLADGEPKGAQVFVVRPATGDRTQLTHVVEAPSNLQWSPDGTRLALSMTVPEKDGFPIELPKPPKGASWADEAKVITRLHYRRDHQGYRPAGWRHAFVLDAEGGTPRQVTNGDFDHGEPQWTPDGKELLVDGLREADADWQTRESEIYAVDVASGNVRQLTRRKGPDRSPCVVDELHFVYLGHDHTGATHDVTRVYALPIAGGEPRCLTADLDRSAQHLVAVPGAAAALFQFEDEGAVRLARLGLDGKRDVLTGKDAWFRLGCAARDGAIAAVVTSPHEPGAIALRSPGGSVTKLTRVHDDVLQGRALGAVEELRWKSADGLECQGWLVHPPGFDKDKRYPLILQIHGGPHAMYGVNFDFERQLHAANDHLLLYCNPRGSTGYGNAFACGIQNAYPGKDYDDLMAGVDAAIARGGVDERNLFVYGGSGGGVLTCWIVGSTDRFRAAVSMFPVTNWISFVGTTDGAWWYENFAKLPWDDVTEHWRRSPLRLVGNVKTPTMLLTGELDLRTPMSQTEEYYQALKLRKVDTVLVRIQDEYHGAGARHPSNRMRRIQYVATWFAKHRAPDPAQAAPHAPANAGPTGAAAAKEPR